MRYLSVCSGIEAASVAWGPLGWTPVAYSEIEKFPSAVLAHHYPDTPNLGDMTAYAEWPTALSPDLLVGGTPCQSFSVAGLRKGMDDPRGNLALVYLGLADRYRPRWLLWENVPGVRSSNGGRDFGAFLGGLGELGYGWSYRSLDAQYFGLAQRRQRVFVVASLGGWGSPAAVLFEAESLQGHPAPSRGEGERVAPTLEGRATAGGGLTPHVANPLTARMHKGINTTCDEGQTMVGYTPARGVRRLTPRECERLQGFPDDYTLVKHTHGKPAADGPRYRALGNSMAVPVMRWIGKRIDQVDAIINPSRKEV